MGSAIAAFREAASVDPDNLDAMERLAAALHRSGQAAEAKALFESVVARAPDRPAPQLSLAMLDLEAGRPREAIVRLQRIRSGWPGAYRAECFLGEAFLAIDDRTRSREAYSACASKAPPGDPLGDVARRALSTSK
jgi:predicted Zn-dependent protease